MHVCRPAKWVMDFRCRRRLRTPAATFDFDDRPAIGSVPPERLQSLIRVHINPFRIVSEMRPSSPARRNDQRRVATFGGNPNHTSIAIPDCANVNDPFRRAWRACRRATTRFESGDHTGSR